MKTVWKVLGFIVGCLVLLLIVLRLTGFDPHGRIPGLWLTGEVVTTPIADWSFVDRYRTDQVQTRSWYLLPHSVTTNFFVSNGQLYLTTLFPTGVPFPQDKSWTSNVIRDRHVRLKFGNRLYDCILSPVTDPTTMATLTAAAIKKYPEIRTATVSHGRILHLFQALPE